MSDQRTRRILREMDDTHTDAVSGVTLEPVADNICKHSPFPCLALCISNRG